MLSAVLLLSVAFSGYPARDTAAAEHRFVAFALSDSGTGKVFFNVIRNAEPGQLVVFRTADGEWMRLPDHIRSIWVQSVNGCYGVPSYALSPSPFTDACYDPAKDELVYTTLFEHSPSGKWGLKRIAFYRPFDPAAQQTARPHSVIHYGYGPYGMQKQEILLLRNNATGEIRQIAESSTYPIYVWLKDGTLLLQQFSETDRQNELVRIHPATGETKRFMLGSLRGYNAELGWLLYVINEPSRTLRIYDFAAGKSRLATADEIGLFYPPADAPKREEPSFPGDLDIDALPVADTRLRTDVAATLTLDGADIPLPFAFVGLDGETYVPLRPLVDRGWTIRQEPLDRGFEYAVRSDRGELRVNRSNSYALNDRLYIPIRLIESLGHTAELKWRP
jgi:hypothetical protein